MDKIKKILFIDFCNFEDYQIGGHLSFAKSLMSAFGTQLSLIGITTDEKVPLGKWIKKDIDGTEYDFFALARYTRSNTKHLLPDRISCVVLLRYFKSKILKMDFHNVFVQRPEILPAIRGFGYTNICYCFPGVENPMKTSKYWLGKYVAIYFDTLLFSSLEHVKIILASADENAIGSMVMRSKGKLQRQSVIKFPTRINTDIYKPIDKNAAREKLKIPYSEKVVITVGRLSWLKGWKLMIDSFILFEKNVPGSVFYFIGEGEDFDKIKNYVELKSLKEKVFLVGRKTPSEVALFLSASDLFIMGSYKEGWSTSLIEAIACGIPSCVTNFSSAKEIIKEGLNGCVIEGHNADAFAQGMIKSVDIQRPAYNKNVKEYATDKLKEDLLINWKLI